MKALRKVRQSTGVQRLGARLMPWLVPMLLLLVWQVLTATGQLSTRILPTPGAVLHAAVTLTRSGELPHHLAVGGPPARPPRRVGGSNRFVLGLVTGIWPTAECLLDSSVQMVRTIPSLAMIPLIILWFGIGETAKVLLIALGVFFPIYLNTFHGIRTIDSGLKEMGRVYGLQGWSLFTNIIFPGALPSILIGLRFALGVMWITLIGAETLAAEAGIGYMTTTAREFMQTDIVVVGTLVYALLGKLADGITRMLERRLLPWRSTAANA